MSLALASRLFFVAIAMVAASQVQEWAAGTWNRGPAWVQPFARWDSGYYLDIATDGYGPRIELWAFHPGYPLVIRALMVLAPGLGPEVAGFLVSNACFFLALPLFFRLTEALYGCDMAIRSAAALVWFPASFFLTAIYPESLFLVLLLFSLDSFRREKWVAAGLWAAAANAVRPQGLFIAGAFVAVLAWRWLQGRRPAWRGWSAPLLGLSFVALFSIFAWQRTGDPLIWLHAREAVWPDVGWHDPFTTVWRSFTQIDNNGLSFVGLALLVAASIYGVWQVRTHAAPGALAAYALTAILLLVHAFYAATPSLLRYNLAALPVFWMLAHAGRTDRSLTLILVSSALLGAYVTYLFATWGPAF